MEEVLNSLESRIPLSNFKSGLIQLIAIWPQASPLQSGARAEDAEEEKSEPHDNRTLESVYGLIEAWSSV